MENLLEVSSISGDYLISNHQKLRLKTIQRQQNFIGRIMESTGVIVKEMVGHNQTS